MEAQPSIAVNPGNSENIAVVWMEDWADSLVVGVTYDGGRSWTKSVPPGVSHCTGAARYNSAVNPHLAFSSDGATLYLSTFNLDSNNPVSRVIVSTSRDGGSTWEAPVVIDEPAFGERFLDWSWVVGDPTNPDVAYASWMSFDPSFSRGVMLISRTTDRGATWSSPTEMGITPPGYWRGPPRIVVLADGTLVNMFFQLPACHPFTHVPPCRFENLTLMSSRSTDRGNTWSAPVTIDVIPGNKLEGDLRRIEGVVQAQLPALDAGGTIHYAWTEIAEDGSSIAYLIRSSDGGRSWSERRVLFSSGSAMMNPNLTVTENGSIGLLFYDDRNDKAGDDGTSIDAWLATSSDGGSQWKQTHLGGPFDAGAIPGPPEYPDNPADDIGEYQGIAAIPGDGIALAFTMASPVSTVGPTDIFFARVKTK